MKGNQLGFVYDGCSKVREGHASASRATCIFMAGNPLVTGLFRVHNPDVAAAPLP